jgi:enoyl-CoA hydratase/carnithine racemase
MAPRQQVRLTFDRGVACIELWTPRTGNRISPALASEFRASVAAVMSNESVRVVLIGGRGRDFCAGGVELRETAGRFDELKVAESVARIPQPVLIAAHGRVYGQGLELALAGDIRIASREARFAMPQVVAGSLPFDGGTQRLPRIAGRGLATDMLLTGRELDADDALAAGLVTAVIEPGQLAAVSRRVAAKIAKRGSAASRFAKEAIGRGVEMPLEDGMRLETDLSLLLFGDRERAEGLAAFREMRR